MSVFLSLYSPGCYKNLHCLHISFVVVASGGSLERCMESLTEPMLTLSLKEHSVSRQNRGNTHTHTGI